MKRGVIVFMLSALIVACHANRDLHRPISFVESEGFTVNDEISKALGYKLLKVSSGNYQVKFDSSHKFGYVVLNLEAAEKDQQEEPALEAQTPGDGFGIRIRIARRDRGCQFGIGFRCGLVPAPKPKFDDSDSLSFSAIVHVEEDRLLNIEFQEEVPWNAIERRYHQ